jgi:hypothetical protein
VVEDLLVVHTLVVEVELEVIVHQDMDQVLFKDQH